MTLLVQAVLIGVAVGAVVGALGAGGGILAVPILVHLLHQDPHAAAASSLVIVGTTALTSLPHHARRGNVDWRQGLMFGGVSVVGGFAGSRTSVLVPAPVLMVLFGAMLLVMAAVMAHRALTVRRDERAGDGVDAVAADVVPRPGRGAGHGARVAVAASATGFLAGFFGVGGGFMVIPVLVLVLALSMPRASGTSLVVMVMAAATGLLSRIGTPVSVDWPVTLLFTAGSALGGILGGPLAARARPSTLALVFAGLLLAVAITTLALTLPDMVP